MAFNQTEKQEKEYLKQIISFLKKVIGNTDASVKDHVDTLAEYKDYIWSNKDIDPHEIRSMRESILNHFALGESVINKRKRLTKILAIPYFGRIDFLEKKENSKVMPIYIGIHTFYDPESRATLIHDWRAPVSSMFYDHELGEAGYRSPSGEIKGEISLKRQYRIRGGKMEFMIESALTVHDDILQKELSSNADDKMKNIVATIQREQNRIIRNEDIRTLIIQGGRLWKNIHRPAPHSLPALYLQRQHLVKRYSDCLPQQSVFRLHLQRPPRTWRRNRARNQYGTNTLRSVGTQIQVPNILRVSE